MRDFRFEARFHRADEIEVQWKDQQGHVRKIPGHLKDISLSGTCLQIDQPIPWKTPLRITQVATKDEPTQDVTGKVRFCSSRGATYLVGVRFDVGCEWRVQTRTAQI
jgi:hypothetical protein